MAFMAGISGAVLGGAGALNSAQAQKRQGEAEAGAAEHNAQVALVNAQIARSQGAADVATVDRAKAQKIGAARAAYGASGVTIEGSPLDVLERSAWNAELDKQNVLYKSNLKAMGYEDQSAMEMVRAKNARSGAAVRAGSEILLGAAKAADKLPRGKSGPSSSGYQVGDYDTGDYNYDTGNLA